MLPYFRSLWTSAECPLTFVEILGRRSADDRLEYVIVLCDPRSGYATILDV